MKATVVILYCGKPTAVVNDAPPNAQATLRMWLEYQGIPVANRRAYSAEPIMNVTNFATLTAAKKDMNT